MAAEAGITGALVELPAECSTGRLLAGGWRWLGVVTLAASAALPVTLLVMPAAVLELGVPFSDPLADGMVNQLAAQRGLESGTTPPKVLETVAAIVVLKPGATASEADIIAFCREHLAHFKCPRAISFVDALPRTATGKLQKFRLRAPYWEGIERQVN